MVFLGRLPSSLPIIKHMIGKGTHGKTSVPRGPDRVAGLVSKPVFELDAQVHAGIIPFMPVIRNIDAQRGGRRKVAVQSG